MSEKKRKRWKGNLNRPIKTEPPPDSPTILEDILNPDSKAEFKKKRDKYLVKSTFYCATEALNKMNELLEHYEIDKNDLDNRWYLLAFRLATDHVPGFRVEQKKELGRPQEWDIVSLAILYCDVKDVKREREEKGLSAKMTDICQILSKREPYKLRRGSHHEIRMHNKTGITNKTIVNLYMRAKESPLVLLFNSFFINPKLDPIETLTDFRKMLSKLPYKG